MNQTTLSQFIKVMDGGNGNSQEAIEQPKEQLTAYQRRKRFRRLLEKYNPNNAHLSTKQRVVLYYSNGTMKCACCGEDHLEFLTINHMHGGGVQHRKRLAKAGTNLYQWLIKRSFPEDFNVLCFNCNFAEGHYEKCPHKLDSITLNRNYDSITPKPLTELVKPAPSSYDYISGNVIKSVQHSLGEPKSYHKGHRYLFVFRYEGVQPIHNADSLSKFGRFGTITKARFNYSEDKAIVFSLPHSLLIWIKHPVGSRTQEELAQAHRTAWKVAESFSRKHGIQITSEKEAGFSEHTVENKPLDGLIRPIVVEEPILAKERLDLSINHTSHKDKVEWTGRSAKERVMTLERLLDTDLLEKIDTIEQGVGAISEGIAKLINGKKPAEAEIKPIDKSDEGMYR